MSSKAITGSMSSKASTVTGGMVRIDLDSDLEEIRKAEDQRSVEEALQVALSCEERNARLERQRSEDTENPLSRRSSSVPAGSMKNTSWASPIGSAYTSRITSKGKSKGSSSPVPQEYNITPSSSVTGPSPVTRTMSTGNMSVGGPAPLPMDALSSAMRSRKKSARSISASSKPPSHASYPETGYGGGSSGSSSVPSSPETDNVFMADQPPPPAPVPAIPPPAPSSSSNAATKTPRTIPNPSKSGSSIAPRGVAAKEYQEYHGQPLLRTNSQVSASAMSPRSSVFSLSASSGSEIDAGLASPFSVQAGSSDACNLSPYQMAHQFMEMQSLLKSYKRETDMLRRIAHEQSQTIEKLQQSQETAISVALKSQAETNEELLRQNETLEQEISRCKTVIDRDLHQYRKSLEEEVNNYKAACDKELAKSQNTLQGYQKAEARYKDEIASLRSQVKFSNSETERLEYEIKHLRQMIEAHGVQGSSANEAKSSIPACNLPSYPMPPSEVSGGPSASKSSSKKASRSSTATSSPAKVSQQNRGPWNPPPRPKFGKSAEETSDPTIPKGARRVDSPSPPYSKPAPSNVSVPGPALAAMAAMANGASSRCSTPINRTTVPTSPGRPEKKKLKFDEQHLPRGRDQRFQQQAAQPRSASPGPFGHPGSYTRSSPMMAPPAPGMQPTAFISGRIVSSSWPAQQFQGRTMSPQPYHFAGMPNNYHYSTPMYSSPCQGNPWTSYRSSSPQWGRMSPNAFGW